MVVCHAAKKPEHHTCEYIDMKNSRHMVVCRAAQEAGAPHPWVYRQEEQ